MSPVTLLEGRGFILRTAPDGPWAGWAGSRFLEEGLASVHAAPGRALARLMGLAGMLPGGFALVWDHPPAWMQALPSESRQGWWEAIAAIPGLTLHLDLGQAGQLPGGAFRGWVHTSEVPEGTVGELWRQGVLGWVPQRRATWALPGLGALPAAEEVAPGWVWGEATLAVGALAAPGMAEALATTLGEAQGLAERGLAQRLSEGAWVDLPFVRRAVGWRLALAGGVEFQRSGGSWPAVFGHLRAFKALLQERLRTPIHFGASGEPQIAGLLGRQALREGLPWRASLPLPPAPGAFTPGLTADPRDPVPLEARALQPLGWTEALDHPPAVLLRVPAIPSEAGARDLADRIQPAPALRWLPPSLPPPGPFDPERSWAAAGAFPFPADPGSGVQHGLFEDLG